MFHNQPRRIRDLEKTSLLQVVRRNFSYYDRNTFVHRLIYVGEVSNSDVNSSTVIESFEKSIKPINDRYCDESITGFLLYVGNCFCHVLESSEESLVRHLRLLRESDKMKTHFDMFKLVVVYHHMNQRFIDDWVPVTVDQQNYGINKDKLKKTNLEETFHKVKSLIKELYTIGNTLKIKVEESKARMRTSKQRLRFRSFSSSHVKISIDSNILPRSEDLEFLVQSSFLKPLKIYLDVYNKVPHVKEDGIWPVGKGGISLYIFEEKINPVGELSTKNSD